MKTIAWTKYGPPEGLRLGEVEMPSPTTDEILVKNRAASVTPRDCEMRRMQLPLGLSFPFQMYAGVIKPNLNRLPPTPWPLSNWKKALLSPPS